MIAQWRKALQHLLMSVKRAAILLIVRHYLLHDDNDDDDDGNGYDGDDDDDDGDNQFELLTSAADQRKLFTLLSKHEIDEGEVK